jgi:two-component system cell cycle sensor histidine kinase/response regulator CckA
MFSIYASLMKKKRPDNITKYLESRIRYLEEGQRFVIDALDMAASLGDFQSAVHHPQNPVLTLKETNARINQLFSFEASAFYLVDEGNQEFRLVRFDTHPGCEFIEQEVDCLIENGTFAWALREKRPVIVSAREIEKKILLHILTTNTRIRGMFAGLFTHQRPPISDISLSLLSIILLNSANTLESYEFHRMKESVGRTLEKEKNYKILFESSPDGIEVLDTRGVMVECNKTQQDLVGYERKAMVGCHTTRFFSADAKSRFEESYVLLKETGRLEGEIELVHNSGTALPVWRKARAIYDEKGLFVGAVINNRDISARKKVEEENRLLQARLQRAQKMEALGILAGGVAHDLNNILGGLVSYPELLLMQLPEDSSLRKPIMTIQKSGEKAAAVVQDLLTLARRGVVNEELANLNDILSDYLSSPEFGQLESCHPEVAFEIRLEKDLFNMMASPVHLFKSIANLVTNAVEAIPQKGHVVITTQNRYIDTPIRGFEHIREGEYVSLIVADDGVGISAADVDRIFEPFYTKKVMGRSGTGLGMAVVWGAVKDHEGYIDVQSREGEGTTITVCFPATRREMGLKPSPTIDAYTGRGESILVVDDLEDQRMIAAGMLKNLGYRVAVAASGEEAVAYVQQRPVDLLVIDMIMAPGMDGLDTFKRILRDHPSQKAIIVSGFSESKRVREARKQGIRAYVRKPYLLENIGVAVREALK